MSLRNILSFGHQLLAEILEVGDFAVDATVGNGHDTVFLAELVGEGGHVYGFDIQQEALEATRKKLEFAQLADRVTLFQESHHHLGEFLDGKTIKGAIFNLGYLPGGDKSIVTVPKTTIAAVNWLTQHIVKRGIIVVAVYPGHPEGELESEAFLDYVSRLDQKEYAVIKYDFLNRKNNPPYLIVIEKI